MAPTRSFVADTFQQSTRLARVLNGATRIGNAYLNNHVTTNKRTTLKLFISSNFEAKREARYRFTQLSTFAPILIHRLGTVILIPV